MVEAHVGDQGILLVEEFLSPFLSDPGKEATCGHAKPEGVATDLVLLAYMREIEIPDKIILIKAHEEPTVPYRDIAGHVRNLPSSVFSKVNKESMKVNAEFENFEGGCQSLTGARYESMTSIHAPARASTTLHFS
jgi:hypothetical protein